MLYLHTKLHMPSSNDLVVTNIKAEAKYYFTWPPCLQCLFRHTDISLILTISPIFLNHILVSFTQRHMRRQDDCSTLSDTFKHSAPVQVDTNYEVC
jgi:hypothetical protein